MSAYLCSSHCTDILAVVTNYGEGGRGQQHGRGGGGEGETFLAMLKGLEVVLTQELEVLAIVMGGGGRTKFPPFNIGGRGAKSCTLS